MLSNNLKRIILLRLSSVLYWIWGFLFLNQLQNRCSINIFVPMIIRMTPPQSSARSLRAMPHPKRIPNISPTNDKANDTNPMMPIEGRMDEKLRTPRNANETPTAKASILVATANAETTFRLVGSNSCLHLHL